MFFSLDGLLVRGEETPLLSVAEGQQLVALYRLLHRLHRSGQPHDNSSHNAPPQLQQPTPAVPFPMFLQPEGEAAAVAAAPGCTDDGSGEVSNSGGSRSSSSSSGTSNTNRAANRMEEAHVRALAPGDAVNAPRSCSGAEWSGPGTKTTMQVCTSQRELFCVQRVVPSTSDALFLCGAATPAP
ncbi:hypothetical protein DQ04_15891010 [Trypanosoma grayi]|uniref:hypothetical protein n=1 Tax=Trypanosoma grayi TaxID=71804 RepID=UPI0004F449C4|nr:hypothetical protein DQ04_15891010 [Trypanosoma grayi]KEG06110.1 hypothetical protein DQ04_15891010 [Trypanosoma grayi]